MRLKTINLALLMVFLVPIIASAVSDKGLEVQNTENIIDLCTASPDDPFYPELKKLI
jgi:hypothetical protein